VVVFLYGGSWQYGSRSDYLFAAAEMARRGAVVMVPDYRVYPQVRFPAFIDDAAQAVLVRGRDEAGVDLEMKLPLKAHAEATGWLVREAQERIPRRVDIPEGTLEKLPAAVEHAGQRIDLEPLQVVGKKDAITGKMITYEPDARVCPRCERVYAKRSVPKKCKCGQSLVHLRPKDGEEDADGVDEDTSLEETAETAES